MASGSCRASWVRINDVLKYELARGSFGGDYWHDHVYTLDSPDLSQLSPGEPGRARQQDHRDRQSHRADQRAGQLEGIDPDIKPMSHDAFDVSTRLPAGRQPLRLTVRYTHKHLRQAIEDIGVLDENESEVYTTGNPGFHSTSDSVVTSTGASLAPKAKRDYDGVEFRIDGRKQQLLLQRVVHVQPALRQLVRSGELRRERTLGSEREPRVRSLARQLRRAGPQPVRSAGDRSAAYAQALRQLHHGLGARATRARRVAGGLQRHAAELGGHVHRADLLQRSRRPRSDGDVHPDGPAC